MINYPKEFIKKCIKVYPGLKENLENGKETVGRNLYDAFNAANAEGINIDKILNATSLSDLKAEALLIKEKEDLYHQWCEIENSAHKSKI